MTVTQIFIVETRLGDTWENTWFDDGSLVTFHTYTDAKKELHNFLNDEDIKTMKYSVNDYRIKRMPFPLIMTTSEEI